MKVVVAPNAFKGSLGVLEVSAAMRDGVLDHDRTAEVRVCPMSDGGDGLCDVMSHLNEGLREQVCELLDALGRPREATYLWDEEEKLAVIESAKANGISFIEDHERDVLRATSYGVGQLIADALGRGAQEVVLGAGGSASVDGGLGCLQALGARVQTSGCEATVLPGGYTRIRSIDLDAARARCSQVRLTALCDVDVPLARGWKIFAPQKGADETDMRRLESGLATLRDALGGRAELYWNGARGGAAGGLTGALSLLGASLHEGAQWVADRAGLTRELTDATLAITGEGKFDATSLVGKAPGCVLRAARELGVPVGIVAGDAVSDEIFARALGEVSICALTELTSVAQAMAEPAHWIRQATTRVVASVIANRAREQPTR